ADEDAGPGAEAAARAGFAAGVEGSAGGGPGQGRGPGLDLDVDHGGEDALDGGAERLAGGDGGGRTGLLPAAAGGNRQQSDDRCASQGAHAPATGARCVHEAAGRGPGPAGSAEREARTGAERELDAAGEEGEGERFLEARHGAGALRADP